MNKEYLKSLIDEVSAIEVKSEAQQIAKYELIEYVEELQDRINNAIEYIKWQENNPQYDNVWRKYECESLVEILKGDNNE